MPYKQIEVTITYREADNTKEAPYINNSSSAAHIARKISSHNTILWTEEAFILCLNSANQLIGWYRVAVGGIDTLTIDTRIIATIALKCIATGVILTHNHPGGNLQPSCNDILTTSKVKDGLAVIDIKLLDHIIINTDSYLSMKEEGYI